MKTCTYCTTKLHFYKRPYWGLVKIPHSIPICSRCYAEAELTMMHPRKNGFPEQANVIQMVEEYSEETIQRKHRLNEIKRQILDLKLDHVSTFFSRIEITELPNILYTKEIIDNIVQANYCDRQGILVSTNNRIIFIEKGVLVGLKTEEFALANISSIEVEAGQVSSNVKIFATDKLGMFDNIEKSSARQFADQIARKIAA
ncbi:MAG: PH domain-containing protein [Flavitalea sp.]